VTAELQRLGALRATLIVAAAAAVAISALALSGLSAAPASPTATIRPVTVQSPGVSATAEQRHRRPRARGHRHAAFAATRKKRCAPMAGVTFTVSAGVACPRLAGSETPAGIPPNALVRLRRAVGRRRASAKEPSERAEPAAGGTPKAAPNRSTRARRRSFR
jgi:hypothetical protein